VKATCADWGVSIRRACKVLEVDTSTYHYKSRRRDQAGVEARIKEIAQARVRYRYWCVHVLLRREGWTDNVKRIYRIYRNLGLQLCKNPPKRRVWAELLDDRQVAIRPNDVWAMDFVHDQLATGQKLHVLTIADTFSRYCPGLDVRFRYRAEDGVATLERVCLEVGYPRTIRGLIRGRSLSAGIWMDGHPTSSACSGLLRAQRSPALLVGRPGFWRAFDCTHCGWLREPATNDSCISPRPPALLTDQPATKVKDVLRRLAGRSRMGCFDLTLHAEKRAEGR